MWELIEGRGPGLRRRRGVWTGKKEVKEIRDERGEQGQQSPPPSLRSGNGPISYATGTIVGAKYAACD